MMTTPARRTVTAACAALVFATSACSSSDDAEPTLPPSTQDEATETTTTEAVETTTAPPEDTTETSAPPTLTPAEQDEADAIAALVDFQATLDSVRQGESDIEALNAVAIGTAREQWITQQMLHREQGWTQEGEVVLEVLEVTHLEDQVEITACSDVSGVDVLDEDGESIVSADRLDSALSDFVLERDESAEHGWIVVEDVNRDEPCDAE